MKAKNVLKRIIVVLLLLTMTGGIFPDEAPAATTNAKKRSYNKNALPYGWKTEPGYTLWRLQRGLAAHPQSYRKYRREKKHNPSNSIGEYTMDGLNWTNEEIAKFWEDYQEWFKFHPAGVTDD